MAEEDDDDELPSVDHGPLNEGPWEKQRAISLVEIKDTKEGAGLRTLLKNLNYEWLIIDLSIFKCC